jgi:DNA-binding response OmpR family regulator
MTVQNIPSSVQPEILVIEDSAVEVEILRRILVRADYRVTLAKNGEEGLRAARARRPALVLSDIQMPLMNGYELCHEIKYDMTLWNVPVVLLTILSEPEDIMQAINGGADAYIIKPFDDVCLLERVRTLLASPIRRKRSEEQRSEKVEYNGKPYTIIGGNQQMLYLLLSVYENTLVQNRNLTHIQTQLNLLNESLDDQVRERTAKLLLEKQKLENVNRTLRIMSACHTALVHAGSEKELFQNVCSHIVETGGHLFAGISFLGEGSKSIFEPALHFGSVAISQRLAELQRDPEYVRHSVALATRFARQTKVYQAAPNDAEYSFEKLAGLGIKSGVALPLYNNDRFYGVLTVFSSTPEAFDAAEVKLMEELAGNIAYGIVTLRARC